MSGSPRVLHAGGVGAVMLTGSRVIGSLNPRCRACRAIARSRSSSQANVTSGRGAMARPAAFALHSLLYHLLNYKML